MLIGKRRARVTIQASTPSQDAHGQPIDSWANLASNAVVWAEVRTKASGESFDAGGQQVQALLSTTVILRYRTDILAKMRVLYGSRILEIENAYDPTGEKKNLVLSAREVEA